ncbi:MAG: hypothetical protein A2W31_07465 [Planctomycetes bacterium RBG_16_64_10]|nr:MAG: hypothetical protein A2W31_07465 [Planctomycetes bacterium RBG_16_64_10]
MVIGVASIPVAGSTLQIDSGPLAGTHRRVRLDHFVAGPENCLAATAIRRILDDRPSPYSPLVLYGRPGVGKSHLARGLARQWRHDGRAGPVVVATSRQFAQQFQAAVQSDTLAQFRTAYRSSSLLVLEEIDSLTEQPNLVQQELIHTLDALHQTAGQVVMTSRVPIRAISRLHPLLASRLVAGLVVMLSPPSVLARREILRHSATALGLPIAERTLQWLADSVPGTVPELVAALVELRPDRAAGTDAPRPGKPPTARGDHPAPFSRPDLARITVTAARCFALKPAQLRGISRQRTTAHARAVAIYLARRFTNQSYASIGRFLGGRDHTTILYNFRKIERLVQTDPETRATVARLARLLACLPAGR